MSELRKSALENENVLKPPDGGRGRRKGDDSAEEPRRLIDWHDQDQIAREKDRKGPGEGGSAYILTAEEENLKSPLYQGAPNIY